MDDRLRGILLAGGGIVALSTDSLFVRLADTDSADVVFWVGAFTALVLLGGTVVSDRRAFVEQLRHHRWALAVAGVLQAATMILFVLAVQKTSVANVTVIIAAAPAVTAVIAWFVLRERTRRQVWAAIAVTAAGVAVVISGSLESGSLAGDLSAVGAIAGFGFVSVLLRGYPQLSRPIVVGLSGLVMAVVTAGQASVSGHSAKTWLSLFAMGAVVGPLARVLITTAPRYLPATEVALFAPVETVLATLWAYLAFDETPAARTWVGGAIVLAAVVWGVWPRRSVVAVDRLASGGGESGADRTGR